MVKAGNMCLVGSLRVEGKHAGLHSIEKYTTLLLALLKADFGLRRGDDCLGGALVLQQPGLLQPHANDEGGSDDGNGAEEYVAFILAKEEFHLCREGESWRTHWLKS